MKTTKRILSLLLAVIMTLSVTTAAFVSVSAATPPIVARTRDVMPNATLIVPDYIETYGTNEYLPGTKVKSIQRAIQFYLPNATNISISCTGNVSLGTTYTYGLYTCADITSGNATANSYVEFVVTYGYNGKAYTTKGYSWVKPATNNGGVFMDWREKKSVQDNAVGRVFTWASPTIGSFEGYIPSLETSGSGSGYISLGDSTYSWAFDNSSAAGQYRWHKDDDSGVGSGSDSHSMDDKYKPTATYYADVSKYQNLSQTPLRINIKQVGGPTNSEDWTAARGLSVTSASLNGAVTTDYSISGYSNFTMENTSTVYSFSFNGLLPTAGSTLIMNTEAVYKIECTGWLNATASCTNTVKLKVQVNTVDKTSLRNLVNAEKAENRQQAYYNDAAWSIYASAYATAYSVLGKPNADQNEINSAYTNLNAAIQTAQNNVVSANYSAIDSVLNRSIPADFYSHPEYYTTATRTALQDAINDINYDRALNVFYQTAVNQMSTNLYNAANALEYNSYTISFNCKGGTTQAAIRQVYKSTVAEPETTTARGGYVFAGWYYDEACTDPVVWPITMPYNGATLYAAWEEDRTTIEFNSNGGSAIASASVKVGGTYGGPGEEPTRKGYNFAGWFYDAALTNEVEFPIYNIPQGGYTLYAKWNPSLYYITFITYGGSNVDPIAAYYNSQVAKPEDPVCTGKNFVAWYSNPELTKIVRWPMTMPAENVVLYAKWTTDNFRIIFDSDGGSEVPEATYAVGAQISAPAEPTKPGYNFLYWSYAGVEFQFTTMPPMNLTLKAVWEANIYTIYFDTLGGSLVAPITQPCGTVVAAPEDPVLEGYLFRGWLLNGEPYTFTTMPPYGANLVAKWIEIPDVAEIKIRTDLPEGTTVLEQGDLFNVTLSMKTNFYCGPTSFIVFYDTRYFTLAINGQPYTTSTTAANITRSGLVTLIDNLNGETGWNYWQTTGSATAPATGRANNTSGSLQYFPAAWRCPNQGVENYTTYPNFLYDEYKTYDFVQVQFAQNASTPSKGAIITLDPEQDIFSFQLMVKEDAIPTEAGQFASILMPEVAIKNYDGTSATSSGKIFATNKSDNSYSSSPSDRVLEYELDGEFNFSIAERSVKPTHTVTFDSNGGSEVAPVVAEETRLVQAPSAPTWQYHTFDGWYLDDELVTWPMTMPDHDITLVAHWIAQTAKYTVKHYKQNTTGINYNLVESEDFNDVVGNEVVAQPKTYEGFTFSMDNSDTTGIILADGSLVLNMRYTRNVSTLTFNTMGGSEVNPITQRYATDITPPAAPTKTGFSFAGWTPALPATMPANDMSFTAVWEPNLYKITFILNGETISSEDYAYGDAIVVPEVNVPDGKVFSGWSPAVPATVPATDMIFTASLDEGGFTVKFVLDGVTISSGKVMEGAAITIPTYVVPDGYKFNGWSPAVPDTMPTPGYDLTFTGTTSKKRNTVVFYLDSGYGYEEYETITKLYGASYEIPEPYIPDGWSFSGWSPAPTGSIPADSTDYYGTLLPAEYTYNFYINGELVKSFKGAIGTAVVTPEIPAQGYTFSGWSPAVPTSISGSDQDFYATLTVNQYTIYFYVDSVLRSDLTITQDYGTPIVPPVVTKQNYTFSGWSPALPETMPANNLSVYGTLTPATGIVTFDANGASGVVPAMISGIIGEQITLPEQGSLRMENHRFLGWNTDKDARKALESYTIADTSVTLYAIWRDISEDEVTLVSNDEEVVYIDAKRDYIYGIPTGTSLRNLESMFTIIGDGYITTESVGRMAGTGTIVSLYDSENNLVHTYTIVVFGDLDGNGRITATDVAIANQALSEGFSEYGDAALLEFAANVVVLSSRDRFNPTDVATLWQAVSDGSVSQVDLSQTYQYNGY